MHSIKELDQSEMLMSMMKLTTLICFNTMFRWGNLLKYLLIVLQVNLAIK